MNGLDIVILHMAHRLAGERTISGCYHILKGKKSGQAIQDAALFRYKSWFGVFPDLQRSQFDKVITELVVAGFIPSADTLQSLPNLSIQKLKQMNNAFLIDKRAFQDSKDPLTMAEIIPFWSRFHLLSQVASQFLSQNNRYHPIVNNLDTQLWVKDFWNRIPQKNAFIESMKDETTRFLGHLEDELLAELFVARLSGYKMAGKTFKQLEQLFGVPESLLKIFFYQTVGKFMQWLLLHEDSILKDLTSSGEGSIPLTKSTMQTYSLLEKGFSVQEISKIRQLKVSTIEDHIIELAIHVPNFDYQQYVSKEVIENVLSISTRLNTKKLSVIKNASLNKNISYFQIRLALLKGN